MDDAKQKIVNFIIFFLVIIITLSIFIQGHSFLSKDDISNNTVSYNMNQGTTIKKEGNEQTQSFNTDKARFFYSTNNKYYMVLLDNYRVYSNPDMGTQDKRFLVNIDNFYSTDSFTGTYEIKNDKIVLTIEAGCYEDNQFSCVVPDGVLVADNIMTLDYSDNEIMFGDVKLLEQN